MSFGMNHVLLTISAVDAYSQYAQKDRLDTLHQSSTINTIGSIFRLFAAGYHAQVLLRGKDAGVSASLPLIGSLTYFVGSLLLLDKNNQRCAAEKRPPWAVYNQWFTLLSFTTHAALTALSKPRLLATAQTALDAYVLYRQNQSSWVCVEKEIERSDTRYRIQYYSPLVQREGECRFCSNQSSECQGIDDQFSSCRDCAVQYIDTKLEQLKIEPSNLGDKYVRVTSDTLPNSPVTRLPLVQDSFLIDLWNKNKNKWCKLKIIWI